MEQHQDITIRDLYPDMSEAELAVAEANLKRYVALVVRIYDRLKAEGKSWPAPDSAANLTDSANHRSIQAKGRIPHKQDN